MKSPAAYATAEQQADLDEERADLQDYWAHHEPVSERENAEMSDAREDDYYRQMTGAA